MSDSEGDTKDTRESDGVSWEGSEAGTFGRLQLLPPIDSEHIQWGSIPVRAPGVDLQAVSSDQAMWWAELAREI